MRSDRRCNFEALGARHDSCKERSSIQRKVRDSDNRTVYQIIPNASGEQWVVLQESGSFKHEFATKKEAEEFARNAPAIRSPRR
jgi:hypothetical protein